MSKVPHFCGKQVVPNYSVFICLFCPSQVVPGGTSFVIVQVVPEAAILPG